MRARRLNTWPVGLLGMLGLVVALESFLSRHAAEFSTVWAAAWKQSGEAARREAKAAEVLGVGDSLVKHGVLPRVLEGRSGRRAYNLAVFNGQAATTYFLLQRAFDSGARPAAVLVDSELLENDPRAHMRLWGDFATFGECLDLAWTARDADLFGSIALARLLPSVRARYEVRANVLGALRTDLMTTRFALRSVIRFNMRNWDVNRGAHITPLNPHPAGMQEAIARSNFLPSTWECHPVNAVYVHRLLALARSRGIPVYWLLPPIHPEIQRRRERGGREAIYEKFVTDFRDRYTNLIIVDGRHSGYDAAAMWDLTHLSRRGASVFSADLGDFLRHSLAAAPPAGSRWIDLPTYRDRPIDIPVEDLDQSRLAVREAHAAKRR